MITFSNPLCSLSDTLLIALISTGNLSPSRVEIPVKKVKISFASVAPSSLSFIITGKNPFREGSINALEVLQKTETITPVQYSIKGDTQSQFMALLGAMMGKYPSRRPRTAKQAMDWLKVAKNTFVYE